MALLLWPERGLGATRQQLPEAQGRKVLNLSQGRGSQERLELEEGGLVGVSGASTKSI